MSRCLRNLAVAAALFTLVQPGYALSQGTYQPSADQPPSNSPSGHHRHHGQHGQQPSSSPESAGALRDADDRKLDSLADEYYRISAKDKHPAEKLRSLEKRVKEYQSTLEQRTYSGSADLIHDTVNLEHRIEAKEKKLAGKEARKAAAPVPVAPASASSVPAALAPVPPTLSVPTAPAPSH